MSVRLLLPSSSEGITDDPENPWIELPDGYALFVHCKPRPDGSMREDVYMFVSMIVAEQLLMIGINCGPEVPVAAGVR